MRADHFQLETRAPATQAQIHSAPRWLLGTFQQSQKMASTQSLGWTTRWSRSAAQCVIRARSCNSSTRSSRRSWACLCKARSHCHWTRCAKSQTTLHRARKNRVTSIHRQAPIKRRRSSACSQSRWHRPLSWSMERSPSIPSHRCGQTRASRAMSSSMTVTSCPRRVQRSVRMIIRRYLITKKSFYVANPHRGLSQRTVKKAMARSTFLTHPLSTLRHQRTDH